MPKILLLCALSLCQIGHAAITLPEIRENVINAFDPGQAQQKLIPNTQFFQARPLPSTKKALPPTQVISSAQTIRLKLTRVIITGNKVFSTKSLESIFASSLNKTITLADLQSLIDEITKKYRSSGYTLSQAILPPQRIKHGVVQVKVIEGYVSKVTIAGNAGSARYFLQKYGDNILASKPLQLSLLEKEILLANDLSGLDVKAVITPSANVPGSADLTLYANRKPINAYVAYDNYGTRYLGPLETSFGLSLNSLLLPGDSNALHLTATSKTKELQFAEFVHLQPLGGQGVSLSLGANYTQTQPGFILTPVDIVGRSDSIYSNLIYPVIRTRNHNLNLNMLATYQNINATILGGPFYQDRIRSLAVGANYSTTDHWQGYDTVTANLTQGFKILGAGQHYYQSRPFGRAVFTLIDLNASRTQSVSQRVSLLVATEGQYSFNSLLAAEQFGFGGSSYGRGYDPYAISGDRGLGGKVELRFLTEPNFRFLHTVQFYAFYDAGVIWNIDKTNLPGRQDATSTGGGARINFMNNLDGEFFVGKPLTLPVFTLLALHQNGNRARAFFQLIARA